jgi:spermidine synthase
MTEQGPDPGPVPSGREVIARVTTPTGEWQLQRRGDHYEIISNGVFLMASYNRESDRQLARLALARLEGGGLRVLVGGLGIGFTAQATLEDPRVTRVDVVEIEPLVAMWQREYFARLTGSPQDDPRFHLIEADLSAMILPPQAYDAILLDTDNGPAWLVRENNRQLYAPSGVGAFLKALRPGGVITFWSADRAMAFAAMLGRLAGRVEEIEVPELIAPDRIGLAWIYLISAD